MQAGKTPEFLPSVSLLPPLSARAWVGKGAEFGLNKESEAERIAGLGD